MMVTREEILPLCETDEASILPGLPKDKHNTALQFFSTNNDSSSPLSFKPLLL